MVQLDCVVDMRKPNLAVQEQKYPIPLVDEVIQKLDGAEVISELDFRCGYHQLALDEESRVLTTFATESGVYRYKRLIFGLSIAAEVFQYHVREALKGCEGVENISDNVVVYGKDHDEHNARLEAVLTRLEEKNLTLIRQKCKFGVKKLEFMGYLVSSKGVQLTESKIEAVMNAKSPKTVSEVRSFFGFNKFLC